MELVLNEWLIEYMAQAGRGAYVSHLLDIIESKGDKIAVGLGTPFTRKFYKLNALYGGPGRPFRPIFRRFNLLLYNSSVVRLISAHEMAAVPDYLAAAIHADDLYLVQVASMTTDRTIVTTDETLRGNLNEKEGFKVFLLDEFCGHYLPPK